VKWIKTKFPGVRYRDSDKRRFKGKPDRYYAIRYSKEGRSIEESAGWESDGMSPLVASQKRGEIIQNIRMGQGHSSLKEKRKIKESVKQAEEKKKKEVEAENVVFDVLAQKYLKWARDNKKSWKTDLGGYVNHIAPVIGTTPIKDISVLTMERLKRSLQKKGLSATTVRYYLATTRSIFNKGIGWGLFNDENPVTAANKLHEKFMKIPDNQRKRFLSEYEADQLLKALLVPDKDTHDMALISLRTGMRAGEITSLRLQDLDLQHKIINIPDTKNDESREAYMRNQIYEMLKERCKSLNGRSELIFKNRKGTEFLKIPRIFGHTVNALGYNRGIDDPRQKIVFHSLRHTFASWLCLQGIPLITVKELMGHKRIEMTERYSHLLPGHKRQAIADLEAAQSKMVSEGKEEII